MTLLIIIIALALIFDYINGFHDAANSIATIVSTKVLTPFQAVIGAALFNFVAFFIFTDHGVANTIAKTGHEQYITLAVILAGVVAAIAWHLLAWGFWIPSTSSHTLIGGFAGFAVPSCSSQSLIGGFAEAAIAHAGFEAVAAGTILTLATFIILAPATGMLMASMISVWFLPSFRQSIGPTIPSLATIALVIFAW